MFSREEGENSQWAMGRATSLPRTVRFLIATRHATPLPRTARFNRDAVRFLIATRHATSLLRPKAIWAQKGGVLPLEYPASLQPQALCRRGCTHRLG